MIPVFRKLTPAWLLVIAAATTAAVVAHVRLVYSVNGNVLFWSNPTSISIVINDAGSDDVTDLSDDIALRNSIDAWNRVTGTTSTLVENTSPAQQARTDWASSDLHTMWFDETDSSGYFPGFSGTVAVTPISFFTNGQIIDADVLFNGDDHLFTTTQQGGRFDIQDVATHELGHLLGLDHCSHAGATMFPYVDPSVILHRSLSADDVRGLRHMYPAGSYATISGTIQRLSDSSIVAGAIVVARDTAGRTVGSTLANASGVFTLQALSAGTYELYACPLDGPVTAANLTPGHTIHTDFQMTPIGTHVVTAGQALAIGARNVDGDTTLQLGLSFDDLPLRATTGTTTAHLLRGSGLTNTCTLTCPDPNITVTPTSWLGTTVFFNVTVPAGQPSGHADLLVTEIGGDRSVLTGALEITPPDPVVNNVVPAQGPKAGGTALTITGTGFLPGARVVIGDQIYVDGDVNGCRVDNSTQITLVTKVTVGGMHDVVVMDASGVEGRDVGAFWSQASPSIDTVFPVAGTSSGGSSITLTGNDFQAGCTVTIDGVNQPNVTFVSPSEVVIVTSAGVPGGPYVLTVTNPTTEQGSAAFTYIAQADPALASVTP